MNLTPEQRAAILKMPPQVAEKIIAQMMGAPSMPTEMLPSSAPHGKPGMAVGPQFPPQTMGGDVFPRQMAPTPMPPRGMNSGLDPYDSRFVPETHGFNGMGQPQMPPLQVPPPPDPDSVFDPNLMEGIGEDPRGMWQEGALPQTMGAPPGASFAPGAEYRTADSGPIRPDQFSSIPVDPGGDKVTNRRVSDLELGQRNALNGLMIIMDELQADPSILHDNHTMMGRHKIGLMRLRDRLGIDFLDIGPDGEERLGNSAEYRQKLLTQVNQYIKEITGAQVGQGDETRRLMAVQPNESDSPTQIIAKLNGAIDLARINATRYRMMLENPEAERMTDGEIRKLFADAGARAYKDALDSGLSPDQARLAAAKRLQEEFGF